MKILHVVHAYHPSTGGSQWLIQNLSERFVADYGDEVSVFTTVAYTNAHFLGDNSQTLPQGTTEINGVKVRRFKVDNRFTWAKMVTAGIFTRLHLPYNDYFRTLYNGPIVPGLTEAITQSEADVILAMAFPLRHMYQALAGAKQAGKPLVFMGAIHATDSWAFERPMMFKAIQQANAYIALTPFERDFLLAHKIPAEKISVIGGGVDMEPFARADGGQARARYNLGNGPLILTIGKQEERKRFDLLLSAMSQVWQAHPDTQLVIAGGEGGYTAQLNNLLNALPSAQRQKISLISNFPEEDKPYLLAACDLFVLASAFESFGIVFVEAWACQKPVIGAKAGAIASLIDDGKDGLLFEADNEQSLAQAMIRLLADANLRQKMGQAGYEKAAQQYDWGGIVAQVRALYEKLAVVLK